MKKPYNRDISCLFIMNQIYFGDIYKIIYPRTRFYQSFSEHRSNERRSERDLMTDERERERDHFPVHERERERTQKETSTSAN